MVHHVRFSIKYLLEMEGGFYLKFTDFNTKLHLLILTLSFRIVLAEPGCTAAVNASENLWFIS